MLLRAIVMIPEGHPGGSAMWARRAGFKLITYEARTRPSIVSKWEWEWGAEGNSRLPEVTHLSACNSRSM